MSSSSQIFDNKLVTMEEVKINRFWSKFVVLFIIVSGIFSAAHELKVEWVVVEGISGYADGTEERENRRKFAEIAASVVANILSPCSIFEDWPHYKGKQINFYLF